MSKKIEELNNNYNYLMNRISKQIGSKTYFHKTGVDKFKEVQCVKLKASDVPFMIPDFKNKVPLNKYVIGADFCEKENKGHFSVFNRTTNQFENHAVLYSPSREDFDEMCNVMSEYFNAPILVEK